MSKTKPLGAGTRNLTANLPNDLYSEVVKWAKVSGCKIGEYVRAICEHAAEHGLIVQDNPDDLARYYDALAKGERPLPKVRKEVSAKTPNLQRRKLSDASEPCLDRNPESPLKIIPRAKPAYTTSQPRPSMPSSVNEVPPAQGPTSKAAGARESLRAMTAREKKSG